MNTNRTILENSSKDIPVRFNLTFVRHAETNANADGIIQGLLDTELSHIGYLQSQALGQYLQYHRFTHIYSSDLKRASETARQIRSCNCASSCEIIYDSSLRERMYGVAQGRTRHWLRELAKEHGVPYVNFTPPGAESVAQVRERAMSFFQKLCNDVFHQSYKNSAVSPCVEFYTPNSSSEENDEHPLIHSISTENLISDQETMPTRNCTRSLSVGNIQVESTPLEASKMAPYLSSIDSAIDLSSLSSDQQSIASSMSLLSRDNSFEKYRNLTKSSLSSPYTNDFSDIDILVVTHGAVIREFIKYFACDLQTDIGHHLDTIQDIAPNTSITRFQVAYSFGEDSIPSAKVELVDYHNKIHLLSVANDEYNLDVVNKCSL